MTTRGFTLIELLVVVAIIGLLSSIVISSLNTARTKAADASVKSELNAMRTQAEIIYSNTGSYDAFCTTDTQSISMFSGAAANSSNAAGQTGICLSSGTGGTYLLDGVVITSVNGAMKVATPNQWAISLQLKSGQYFCMDSVGTAGVQAGRGVDNSPLDMACN